MASSRCIAVKPGKVNKRGVRSCVCSERASISTAEKLGIVDRGDPRAKQPGFKSFVQLCAATIQEDKFSVGSTTFRKAQRGDTQMSGYGMTGYGSFGAASAIMADLMPSKAQLMNLVKAGGGAAAAFIAADQLIPRIPWVGNKIATSPYGVYIGAATKMVLAVVAGKFVTKVDPYIGAGLGAGFAGSAIYDLVDSLIFSGTAPLGISNTASESDMEGLFGNVNAESYFSGDPSDSMFSDVEVLQPSLAGILGEASVEVLQPDVGSWIQ